MLGRLINSTLRRFKIGYSQVKVEPLVKKLEDESQAFVAKINKFSDLSYSDLSSLLESSGMDVKSIEKFTVQSNGFDLKDVIDGINSTFTNIKPSWELISIGAIQSY